MDKTSKQNIGNAGEYYLASILSEKDFVVTITLGRNEDYDILAVNPKGKTVKIAVKSTSEASKQNFIMNKKGETITGKDLFYAFVRLNGFKHEPDFWIVPSKVVARILSESHSSWLKAPGKRGQAHKDNPMRQFFVSKKQHYPDNWEAQLSSFYKNTQLLEAVE